jgi:hypothetical protein
LNTNPQSDSNQSDSTQPTNEGESVDQDELANSNESKKDGGPKAFDNPYIVLAIVFLALGAAGLPILNRSNAFSAKTKKMLTLLVVLYTILVVILLIAIVIGFITFVIWMLYS